MKNFKKSLLIASIVPIIISAISVFFLEDSIPMHYNSDGVVNRMGSKYEIFIYPVLILLLGIIGYFTIKNYESKLYDSKNDKTKEKNLYNINLMSKLFFFILTINIISFLYYLILSFGIIKKTINNLPLELILGILMIICGLFIKISKRNPFFGMRTKWSMANDEAWKKSNNFGGTSLMIAGILSILIFNQSTFNKFISFSILMIIIIVSNIVYSIKAYRESSVIWL